MRGSYTAADSVPLGWDQADGVELPQPITVNDGSLGSVQTSLQPSFVDFVSTSYQASQLDQPGRTRRRLGRLGCQLMAIHSARQALRKSLEGGKL